MCGANLPDKSCVFFSEGAAPHGRPNLIALNSSLEMDVSNFIFHLIGLSKFDNDFSVIVLIIIVYI